MQIMQMVLWLLAFVGFCGAATIKGRLSSWSAPLVASVAATLWMYLCGLVGLLVIGYWLWLVAGVCAGVWVLLRHKQAYRSWSLPLLFVAGLLLWLRYRGALLLQYDDFSHWGVMARHLLTNDALPDGNAQLITFQSYPPAAACWIYLVCRAFGGGDGMMLTAQAWWVVMGMLSLFGLVQKPLRGLKMLGLIVPALMVLSVFQGTASLMVDNLLAALTIGGISIALQKRESLSSCALPLGLLLAALSLTKDSGLFFVAVLVGLVVALLCSRRTWKTDGKALLVVAGLPLLARAAWYVHLKVAFAAAELTKHAMSVENMRSSGADKSYADMGELLKSVLKQGVDPANQTVQILLLALVCCAAVVVVRWVYTRQLSAKREAWFWFGSLACHVLYLLALWGMYVFTLPLTTASKLVAFERYNSTCALVLYGALAAYLLLANMGNVRWQHWLASSAVVAALAVPVLIPSFSAGLERLFVETYHVPVRQQLERMETAHELKEDENALVYLGAGEESLEYVTYMARYVFQSIQIQVANRQTLPPVIETEVVYALEADEDLQADMAGTQAQLVLPQ